MIAATARLPRRSRTGRALIFCLAAALVAVSSGAAADDASPESSVLASRAVQLDPEDPGRRRVGRLAWRGGIEITSTSTRFGGLSGLLVSADGARLLAVSDTARWWTAGLRYDVDGRLIGIEGGRTARMRDPGGDALSKKRWRDAESLTVLPDGSILVSFEHVHRIWRYGTEGGALATRATAWPQPEGLEDAPDNSGLEALATLAGGDLLALTEGQENGTGTVGYLWRGGAWSRLTYRPEAGFKPTGASRLPGDDDILVLERAYSLLGGVRVRLVRLAAGDIRPGAVLRGEELARWNQFLMIDNFEGVATRRGPDGETLVYLLSDDNFSRLQRTLLFMFALEEEGRSGN